MSSSLPVSWMYSIVFLAAGCIAIDIDGIRLSNGGGPQEGRVEIKIAGVWGTVCDYSFDMVDAVVMCRMMNLSAVTYYSGAYFGESTGPVFAREFHCDGNESHLQECSFVPNENLCSHSRDVGITCTACDIDFDHGSVVGTKGKKLQIGCDDGYLPEETYVTCFDNGTLPFEEMCKAQYAHPLNISDIRLSGRRVEIKVDEVWGTICYNGFDSNDATVVCGMLGLRNRSYTRFGNGSGPIFMDNLMCNGTESHIQECSYNVSNVCSHSDDVRVSCTRYPLNITDIRLAGTLSSFHGRVEVQVDGEWGTVCHDNFGTPDAKVICRMLGFTALQADVFRNSHYGEGTGSIFVDDLLCQGEESHINECQYIPEHNCMHREDVSVSCFEDELNITEARLINGTGPYEGRAEIKVNGTWGTVCDYTFGFLEAEAFCNLLERSASQFFSGARFGKGTGTIYDVFCDSSDVSDCRYHIAEKCTHDKDVSITCNETVSPPPSNITGIRLAGTLSSFHGRVEVQVDGEWGTVCDDGFDNLAATVICRMLGFAFSHANYSANAYYGRGTGQIFVDDLSCQGEESSINECNFIRNHNCEHSEDVSVSCLNETVSPPPSNITGIRLAGTLSSFHGRVEVQVDGEWGTVCDDGFDNLAATVICRMLGFAFSQANYSANAYYGRGTGPIFVDDLSCQGEESSINECNFIRNHNCEHSEDVSVSCLNETVSPPPSNITGIRLAGTLSSFHGRVEVQIDGEWGTVCDDGFDNLAATVICRMLGFAFSHANYSANAYYGRGTGQIFVDDLSCQGEESSINECNFIRNHNCEHSEDVSVSCLNETVSPPPSNITGIRLAGTLSSFHGRVEVQVDGEWGTVCDDGFDNLAATVICRMLGFAFSQANYFAQAYYGRGTGQIFVDDLSCQGEESSINECNFISNHNCEHSEDVSVSCLNDELIITEARLKIGTSPYNGRAEIKVNGIWGTLCDYSFGSLQAEAFCNLLGKSAAHYFSSAKYGQGSGTIYDIYCRDGKCRYQIADKCTHDRDVAIVCNDCGLPETSHWGVEYFTYNESNLYADCSYYKSSIGTLTMSCDNTTKKWITKGECIEYSYPLAIDAVRLVGGDSKSSGRVELYSLNTWGTVCDRNFGMNEANVICSMIGFPSALLFHGGARFGEGSGPIFADDLTCQENATNITDCTYVTHDNCAHSDDISVECKDCKSPVPTNGYSNSSASYEGAAVEVLCEKDYKLNGDSVVVCQNGTWSDKPTCRLIDCGDPTPENGVRNGTNTKNGTVIVIECTSGYNLHGYAVITCQSNEKWTDYPTCKIIDCGYPRPLYADAILPGNKTTYGETAVIMCWTGYTPLGSTPASCLSNGTWELWPDCEIVDCGDATSNNCSANSTATTYDSIIEITCDPKCDVTGDTVIVCQEDGTWSDSPVCNKSDCGLLSVPNGKANISIGTTLGSVATITCDEGFYRNGSAVAICTEIDRGVIWNHSVVCVPEVCRDPTPEYGLVTESDGTGVNYVFGNYAIIECFVGYEIQGDNVITCKAGGAWSDSTTCQIIECEKLTAPVNGTMDTSKSTKYKSEIVFGCSDGFLLVGEKTIICEENGKWSHETPTCEAKSDVGGHCINEKYCVMEDSRCVNAICSCQTGIYDNRTKKCDTSVCGPKVTFAPGLPIFDEKHTDMYVCTYGFVTFDSMYTNPTPPRDRNSLSSLGKNRLILAPFYAPINKRESGPVSYRTYDILNSYKRMKDDAELISFIEEVVKKYGTLDSFDASFILIATWKEAKPIYRGFQNTKTSTFQVVLISDGKSTYAFYIYGNGLMQWVNNMTNNPRVWIGYTTNSVTYTNSYSFSNAALQLDSTLSASNTASSEKVAAGLVFRPLNTPGKKHENHAVDCLKWHRENYHDKRRIDYIARLLPECPCDIWLSRFDPWFWKIGLKRWRTDINYACVDMLHTGNFNHYGKSCCYDLRTWRWVYERPLAGGFKLYNIHYPLQHILNDVKPKTACCSFSDYCNLYYELRPTGNCYRRSPYHLGRFWGDPHFSTLDSQKFTFNGHGEYTLLKINTSNCFFDLQARTERAVKKNGDLSDATVFTAFAAKDFSNSSMHVERNKEMNGVNLYGNMIDLTNQFNTNNDPANPYIWTSEDNNLTISKRNESVNIFFPSCEISLMISLNNEMLTLTTVVPETLKNTTKGLLGNYDDDPFNDFTLPNGTVLDANLTEREVFAYAMTWAINPNSSAFVYDAGKSHEDFHDETYVPRFLEDADPVLRAKAVELCNGSQNAECIFDFVFTEKEEVALETQKFNRLSEADKVEIKETVPTLTGCSTINAVKGENVSCKFTTSADLFFVSNNVNATVDPGSSTITYLQETDAPVDIRITSMNENGRYSPTFTLNVVLCTACNGHGECNYNMSRQDPKDNEYFRYATCECDPQYEGKDCENELDGCATDPCSWNRTCEKLTAREQKEQNRSYKCGPCPEGFTQDNEDECIDVDECANAKGGCEHNCTNSDGSFECSCLNGYRPSISDLNKCRDINECDEALHNCDHLCNNTEGGFACQCFAGYEFNSTSQSCFLTADVCSDNQKQKCADAHGCTLENGVPVCFCTEGYELNDNKSHCIDIDECSRGVCPQDCVNTVGSFQCVCYKGYHIEGVATCTECDVLHWGDNCEQTCICNGRGADRCDSAKGCICETGWNGDSCNDDINECETLVQACNDSRKECVNGLGSYTCECKHGFYEWKRGNCQDIDECSDPELNTCVQDCENTIGGYTCGCKSGYTKISNTTCKDIDECELGTANCEQRCENSDGLYSCFCHYGYSINDDRRTCSKISDPCLTIKNLNCSHFCLLDNDNVECECRKGYVLHSDNQTCTDVNECTDIDGNRCDVDATCTNTAGSYICQCPVGKQLENDGRTCSECDDFHYGENCLQKCSCLNGACDTKTGCVCDSGWAGTRCDIDIDECATEQVVCSEENTVCVNVLGNAFCSCETGYWNQTGVCQDVDECTSDVCDQNCINTVGSFLCTCKEGFVLKEKCIDIDECSGLQGCDQICENTVGSYRCSCENGFRLNLNDRKTCNPVHDCSDEEQNACSEHSSCYIIKGSANCTCLKGYQNINGVCEDIDECLTTPCSHNCTNTEGSFTCSCNDGHSLSNDAVTCQECGAWKYGYECGADCVCIQANTQTCNSVTGSCTCKAGWTGAVCDADINECNIETVCPNNSVCENRNGSFECKCGSGYFKTGDGKCDECDYRNFGENCFKKCTCNFENTDDCHHETGQCSCKQGWTDNNCTTDVDECTDTPNICNGKPKSTCKNNLGSFFCKCNSGYLETNSTCEACDMWTFGANCQSNCTCLAENTEICDHVTGHCTCKKGWNGTVCDNDINECENITKCPENSSCKNSRGSYNCTCHEGFNKTETGQCSDINECDSDEICRQACNNTIGSFFCTCDIGYFLEDDNVTCSECNEWRFGENCASNCTCEKPYTEACNSATGECDCKMGWNGHNCDEDINECNNETACPAHSMCYNFNGSYDCICNSGYQETATGICEVCSDGLYGFNCSENCQCKSNNTESCNHMTGNCTCKEGWAGTTCFKDVNECEDNVALCLHKANSTCKNTNGSYVCICDVGLREQDNICTDCEIWRYGLRCQSDCTCNKAKSEYCNPTTGKCTCKQGWNGTNCEDDIDECNDQNVCPEYALCLNAIGSFNCKCNKGYFETENGNCDACDMWTFGANCQSNCTCLAENTEICDHVTGHCTCKKGWNGTVCDNDINECENITICPENSSCKNSRGSYNCTCHEGFNKTETGQCSDINECDSDEICRQACNNTIGSFFCTCDIGYFLEDDNVTCSECNVWRFGEIEVGDIMINVTVTLDFSLPNGTNLKSSSTYESLKRKCETSLLEFLGLFVDVSSSLQVIVNDIRIGSLVLDCTIVYSTKDTTIASQLTEAVLDLQNGSEFNFDGQNVSASTDMFKDLEPCEVYQEIIGRCEEGYSCKVENNVPVCKYIVEEEESEVNWKIIIGISAAGLFLLLATSLLLVFVWRIIRRPTKQSYSSQRQDLNNSIRREADRASDFYTERNWQTGKKGETGSTFTPLNSIIARASMSSAHTVRH